MTQPTLLFITGSLRGGSYNRNLVIEAARLFDGTPVMADLDLSLYNGDVEESSGILKKGPPSARPDRRRRCRRDLDRGIQPVAVRRPEERFGLGQPRR